MFPKLKAQSGTKMEAHSGPKMEARSGPKMEAQSGSNGSAKWSQNGSAQWYFFLDSFWASILGTFLGPKMEAQSGTNMEAQRVHTYLHTCMHACIHTYTRFPALSGYLGGECTMVETSFPTTDIGKTQAADKSQVFSEVANNKELHLCTYRPCKMRTALSIHT